MKKEEFKNIEVVDMSPYEYIHYRNSEGREFLTLTHESGFAPFTESFELNNDEIEKISFNKSEFIEECRSTFDHSTKQFKYIERHRRISGFIV